MCWLHHHLVLDMNGVDILDVDGYVELHDQPWYQERIGDGQYTEGP